MASRYGRITLATRQDNAGRFDSVQITGAQQPFPAGWIEDALGVGDGAHGGSLFRFFRSMQYFDHGLSASPAIHGGVKRDKRVIGAKGASNSWRGSPNFQVG
jgi:hypothetical protein